MKILFIVLSLFISNFCLAEMSGFRGFIISDSQIVRDTIYDKMISLSTSCWAKASYTPIKTYIVAVGTTSAHYRLDFEFRINNPNIDKDNIRNYIKKLKENTHIIDWGIDFLICNEDTNKECYMLEILR